MSGFKFPPPPPPPPRASANEDTQQSYPSSQRGGYNNARGDARGRGRGWGGRARGGNNRGNSRGGYPQNDGGRGGYTNHDNARGGYSQYGSTQGGGVNTGSGQPGFGSQYNSSYNPPGGTMYSNPNNAPEQDLSSSGNPYAHNTGKRKREQDGQSNNRPQPPQNQQPKPKPARAKAIPPPAIPSFGFSLPPPSKPLTAPTPKHGTNSPSQKRKPHLGLLPRGEDEKDISSSGEEDEDIDEEAVLGKEFKGLTFVYNDQEMSLQTAADLAAWIKERKRQFPTKQRAEEKAKEMAEKRAHELEFLRRVKAQTAQSKGLPVPVPESKPTRQQQEPPKKRKAVTIPDSAKGELKAIIDKPAEERKAWLEKQNKQKAELDALRKKVEESAAKNRGALAATSGGQTSTETRKAPAVSLGLNYASDSSADAHSDAESDSSDLAESSVVSSDSDSSEADSDEESDSDAAPEVFSTKISTPIFVPPPPRVEKKPERERSQRVCETWKRSGNCRFGERCKFAHPQKEPKKRVGLYDRLVEQEKEAADGLALQAIKYLGSHGLLG